MACLLSFKRKVKILSDFFTFFLLFMPKKCNFASEMKRFVSILLLILSVQCAASLHRVMEVWEAMLRQPTSSARLR